MSPANQPNNVRKEEVQTVIKQILTTQLKSMPVNDAFFISIWLRGLYKAGLSNYFEERYLMTLMETIRHNNVIRIFVEELHTRYVAIDKKAHDPVCAFKDVLIFDPNIASGDRRMALQASQHSPWITSLYHAVRLTAETPHGKRFFEFLYEGSTSFQLDGNRSLF